MRPYCGNLFATPTGVDQRRAYTVDSMSESDADAELWHVLRRRGIPSNAIARMEEDNVC